MQEVSYIFSLIPSQSGPVSLFFINRLRILIMDFFIFFETFPLYIV